MKLIKVLKFAAFSIVFVFASNINAAKAHSAKEGRKIIVNSFDKGNPYLPLPTIFTRDKGKYQVIRLGDMTKPSPVGLSSRAFKKPWIIMLLPTDERSKKAFKKHPVDIITQYLGANFNVFYSRISSISDGTQLIYQLEEPYSKLERDLKIRHLFLGAHGNRKQASFSRHGHLEFFSKRKLKRAQKSNYLTNEQLQNHAAGVEFFEKVSSRMEQGHSRILLLMCGVGKGYRNIAKTISKVVPNIGVLAPIGSLPADSLFVTDLDVLNIISPKVKFKYLMNGKVDRSVKISRR